MCRGIRKRSGHFLHEGMRGLSRSRPIRRLAATDPSLRGTGRLRDPEFLGTQRLDLGTYYVARQLLQHVLRADVRRVVVDPRAPNRAPSPLPPRYQRRCGQLTPAPSATVVATGRTLATPSCRLSKRRGSHGRKTPIQSLLYPQPATRVHKPDVEGPLLGAWRLRIMPPWAGYVNGRYERYVEFSWRVAGRIAALKRVWIYK
jgi:hypothetical protein